MSDELDHFARVLARFIVTGLQAIFVQSSSEQPTVTSKIEIIGERFLVRIKVNERNYTTIMFCATNPLMRTNATDYALEFIRTVASDYLNTE